MITHSPFYIWFTIFACIGYLIVSDENMTRLFVLSIEVMRIQYQKTKWILLNDPGNPVIKFMIYRRSLRLAKKLEKEFNK